MVLNETTLPLKMNGVVRFFSGAQGMTMRKSGHFILKQNNRGEYILEVKPKFGGNCEMKVSQMINNKTYLDSSRTEETKIVAHFKHKDENKTAWLEEGDPKEVHIFWQCLEEAKKLSKDGKSRMPAGRIVSLRASPPMVAQPKAAPITLSTPVLPGLTPSKKRPRDQENQTPSKSLRQANNVRTPAKHSGQTTPAKGEQTPSRSDTPLRAPTPRPDSSKRTPRPDTKPTPGRDSSLSRFKREHVSVEKALESVTATDETSTQRTDSKLRENSTQKDRPPIVSRRGNLDFLDSAKKKFEAGDEKRKSSAVSLSTSFYGNSASRNFSFLPKHKLGMLPAPPPKRLRQAENYTGWSDKNKGLVKSQTHPSLQGFSNLGNTCYMNAILQALRGTQTFSTDLIYNEVRKRMDNTTLYRNITALFQYCNTPTEEQEAGKKQQFLKGVKTAVSSSAQRFSGYLQHDAHEFLSQCLDQLKEDIKKVRSANAKKSGNDKETLSDSSDDCGLPCPVSQNFQFEVIHTIRCTNCEDVVIKKEKFHDLSLTLPRKRKDMNPRSLQDLLDHFFLAEDIEYACGQCKSKKSRVSHQFTKLPRVLILHLKRYNYNHVMSVNRKMEQPVFLPLYLTLQSHCTEDTFPCRPPPIPPSPPRQHTERRTGTSGDRRSTLTSAKKTYSFKPSRMQDRTQTVKSAADSSQRNGNIKATSQLATEEEMEIQKAILLSKETAEAEKLRQNGDFSLDNVSEEEQVRWALENSMVDLQSEEAPKQQDLTLMPPCVLKPLNKENNKNADSTEGQTQGKPPSQNPPPKIRHSIVSDGNINQSSGDDVLSTPDFSEAEGTFEIQFVEEPPTVGLCGGNDNQNYSSPDQVKRRHHSEGGATKLGLSSSKKKRLSSPGGGSGRAQKSLPLTNINGQRTLGKWLRRNCFTQDSEVKVSCEEIPKEVELSNNSGDADSEGKKEEKSMPRDESANSSQEESSTQLEEFKRRKEEKSIPKDDSSQDTDTDSAIHPDDIISISSDLEVTSENEIPQVTMPPQRTDSQKKNVRQAVKRSEVDIKSEQDDFKTTSPQKKDPKVAGGTKTVDEDKAVSTLHKDLTEQPSVKIESKATNKEDAPSGASSQRRASSDNASADPNNNQDLNNNSEADVESESDKENQHPDEEVTDQAPVQGPSLPDWVVEQAAQGVPSYRSQEEEDLNKAMEASMAMFREQKEKEDEDLRKATELSLQEYESCDNGEYEDDTMEEEEAMVEIARSVEEAEDIRKNAETGHLPYSFRLVSVVNHIGKKSSSGHYISDVYDMQTCRWQKWDDSHVDWTSEKVVREECQTSGYIFFYMDNECFKDVIAQSRSSNHN
ncbi:uncharacterized protein LOC144887051 [Branchiostoma floridae x Branchiostoma japonicum]